MDAEASKDSAKPAGPCQDCLRNRASLEGLGAALDALDFKTFFWIRGAFGLGLVAFGAGIAAIIIARRGNGQWTWTD